MMVLMCRMMEMQKMLLLRLNGNSSDENILSE
jgi:hypothetical protein